MSLIKQVLYFDRKIDFPNTGAENVIYVALDEDYGKDYYWDGTSYQKLIGDILLYPYQNSLYENITTIGDALNYLLTPDLSVSLIVTPTYAYSTENIEVNFTWVMSKNVSAISTITMTTNSGLSVIFPDLKALTTGNVGAYSKEMMISANTTFTITIVDTSGNSASASDTIQFVPNVLNITDFAVSPEAGYDDAEYQLDFTATFNRIITAADVSTLTISYPGTTVNLIPYLGTTVNFDDYNLTVTGLAEFVLERATDTVFTLSIELTNGTSDTEIITYYAVQEVSILAFNVAGEIDGSYERITMSTTLTDFSIEDKNRGYYSVIGTITSDALNSNISINYNSASATRSALVPILTEDYDFTLELVQSVCGDLRYPTAMTKTLTQVYQPVEILDFDIVPFQVMIDTPTMVDFSCSITGTKDLSDMTYVGIFHNESGTWQELVDLTESVTGNSFTISQLIQIIANVDYKVKIIETFNGEATTVWSEEETILAVDNLSNYVYWGIEDFSSGLSEGDLLANFTAGFIQQEENIMDSSLYGDDLTQPYIPWQGSGLNPVPLQNYYSWVAFPETNPAFPEFTVLNSGYGDSDLDLLYYSTEVTLTPQISVSVTEVTYRLYVRKEKRTPVNTTFKVS